MSKYHVNYKGEPGVCKASRNCPFGGPEDHFPTPEKAREAYELQMANTDYLSTVKKKINEATSVQEVVDVLKQVEGGNTPASPTAADAPRKRNPYISDEHQKFIDDYDAFEKKLSTKKDWIKAAHRDDLKRLYGEAKRLNDGRIMAIRQKLSTAMNSGIGPANIFNHYGEIADDFDLTQWGRVVKGWDKGRMDNILKAANDLSSRASTLPNVTVAVNTEKERQGKIIPTPPPAPTSAYSYGNGKYGGKY